jgi:hypothetical protein
MYKYSKVCGVLHTYCRVHEYEYRNNPYLSNLQLCCKATKKENASLCVDSTVNISWKFTEL